MSQSSKIWFRRALVASAALPLMGAGYAIRDAGLLGKLPLYVELAFSGEGSTLVRTPPTPGVRVAIRPLGPQARALFAHDGKQPRADWYSVTASARREFSRNHPQFIAAALMPGGNDGEGLFANTSGSAEGVNRADKKDMLRLETTSFAKTAGRDTSHPYGPWAYGSNLAVMMMAPSVFGQGAGQFSFDDNGPSRAWPQEATLASLSVKHGDKLFGGLTEKEFRAREKRCMATAIYFEARGESKQGQAAVGQVIMNRVRSSYYPDTICGVVFQGQLNRNACQFSFACDGRPERARDKVRWTLAEKIASEVTSGKLWNTKLGYATHYHAAYTRPQWASHAIRVMRIGQHIFYKAPLPAARVAENES